MATNGIVVFKHFVRDDPVATGRLVGARAASGTWVIASTNRGACLATSSTEA